MTAKFKYLSEVEDHARFHGYEVSRVPDLDGRIGAIVVQDEETEACRSFQVDLIERANISAIVHHLYQSAWKTRSCPDDVHDEFVGREHSILPLKRASLERSLCWRSAYFTQDEADLVREHSPEEILELLRATGQCADDIPSRIAVDFLRAEAVRGAAYEFNPTADEQPLLVIVPGSSLEAGSYFLEGLVSTKVEGGYDPDAVGYISIGLPREAPRLKFTHIERAYDDTTILKDIERSKILAPDNCSQK